MSSTCLEWAVDATRTGPMTPAVRLVLTALAYHAGAPGQAYPSVETMRARTGLGASTVRRALAWLLEQHLIELGDQQLVSHFRADKRPTVYFVRPIPVGSRPVAGSQIGTPSGVPISTERGPDLVAAGSRFGHSGVPIWSQRGPDLGPKQRTEPRTEPRTSPGPVRCAHRPDEKSPGARDRETGSATPWAGTGRPPRYVAPARRPAPALADLGAPTDPPTLDPVPPPRSASGPPTSGGRDSTPRPPDPRS